MAQEQSFKDTGLNEQLLHKGCDLSWWFLEQRECWVPEEGFSDNSLTRGAFAELWAESRDPPH